MTRFHFYLAAAATFVVACARGVGGAVAAAAQTGASLAQQLIAVFDKDFNGPHPGMRPNHAKGFVCEATFTPTAEAATLSSAAHFKQSGKALVRFSDFGGNPVVADDSGGASPYGMAVKFYLRGGGDTDIVGHSSPFFPAATSEEFKHFLEALGGGLPAVKSYIATHPKAAQFVQSLKAAPVSYATISYHYINAFVFVDPNGKTHNVRYTMQGHEPEAYLDAATAKAKGANYLRPELAERLKQRPVKFDYVAQVANPGDITNDPTHYWPADRRRVVLGTLTITAIVANSDSVQRETLFTPGRLTDGIRFSDDPMVAVRSAAYQITFARRNNAAAAPMGRDRA